MKTSTYFFGLLALAGVLPLLSCQKRADESWPSASAFVGKAWRLEAIQPLTPTDLNGDGTPDANALAFMDACERDDQLTFATDGRFRTDRGATRCSPNDAPDAPGGTYRFFAKTRTISLTNWSAPGDVHEWEVLETSAHTLRVRMVFEIPEKAPLPTEFVFSAR